MANKQAEKQQEEKPATFSTEYLVENASVFGVLPEVVAGALVGKKHATKQEAEDAIKNYLKQPKEQPKEEPKEA